MMGPEVNPENGITGYCEDRTQGPACCMCVGPAVIYRNYLYEGGHNEAQKNQMNNIKDLHDLLYSHD